MDMIKGLRKLLWPIVPAYYMITRLRNLLYDIGIKSSRTYPFPVIAVGNLSVGGTGKSPMVEYLIRLLKDTYTVATLSRGYKRTTKGFQLVKQTDTAKTVGDEPLQFKLKYPSIHVAVDANRQSGIATLQQCIPELDIILLDDAYQHRRVKAGLYILLTAYHDLYSNDVVLPVGNLREPRNGARRAHIVIVTKCPAQITQEEQQHIAKQLGITTKQTLFFSKIVYAAMLKNEKTEQPLTVLEGKPFTLVTGIANPKPLVSYYKEQGLQFTHINYPDHHNFTQKELEGLQQKGLIVTTEKDYVRLSKVLPSELLWYQPIHIEFIAKEEAFNAQIRTFVQSYAIS